MGWGSSGGEVSFDTTKMVAVFGIPIALLLGWPLSILFDRVLLVRVSVRAVHVLAYAAASTVVPFAVAFLLMLDLGGVDGYALLVAGAFAAPAGVGADVSRYLMRWFEREHRAGPSPCGESTNSGR